jgi:hypothetical protein
MSLPAFIQRYYDELADLHQEWADFTKKDEYLPKAYKAHLKSRMRECYPSSFYQFLFWIFGVNQDYHQKLDQLDEAVAAYQKPIYATDAIQASELV